MHLLGNMLSSSGETIAGQKNLKNKKLPTTTPCNAGNFLATSRLSMFKVTRIGLKESIKILIMKRVRIKIVLKFILI